MLRNISIAGFLLASIICLFSNFTWEGKNKPHPYNFKYPRDFGKPNIPDDNPMTVEGVWLGRLLFYDNILSINGKMSCSTCHLQNLSFTDGRKFAVGVHGDTLGRNTMSLVNLAWGKLFFWDGRALTLEALVKEPIANAKEMGGLPEVELIKQLSNHPQYPVLFKKAFPNEAISLVTVSKAIAQFMRTIVSRMPSPGPSDSITDIVHQEEAEYRALHGYDLDSFSLWNSCLLYENSMLGSIARVTFMQCNRCHVTEGFHGQIATKDQNDSLFKAPTLMNVMYTPPYFHDGRFKTLREVLQFYNDNMETLEIKNPDRLMHLTDRIKFTEYDLENANKIFDVFNDSSINVNPAYTDPFKQKGFSWSGIKEAGRK